MSPLNGICASESTWSLTFLPYAGRFIISVTDEGGLTDTSFRIKIQKIAFPAPPSLPED